MDSAIPGYNIDTNVLFKSPQTVVYRGSDEQGQQVILKMINQDYPTAEESAWLKREYQIIESLKGEGCPESIELKRHENKNIVLLKDPGGELLASRIQKQKLPLEEFKDLAVALATSLSKIHLQNIVIKRVNPFSILWDADNKTATFLDFYAASELSREMQDMGAILSLSDYLPYISPEQTGRMNREVDYRTDYYSLGVTLYQAITGRLPFEASDAMEWIYSHIAKIPQSPSELDVSIPEMLSLVISKLVEKNIEDRYQSMKGMTFDLERALLSENSEEARFVLGEQDVSESFQVPQKLYGREEEIEEILKTFESSSKGKMEFMLVAGYSGVGKSSLINEAHTSIVHKKGYFVEGKFDQFQRDVPYSAISKVFSELVQQILSEPSKKLESWKNKLYKALGQNGKVITDLVPELTKIIGKQNPVPELNPSESKNRFLITFHSFLSVFASKEHPLVIFLDDLQWSDLSSLELLEYLLSLRSTKHVFLIGAYRNNEVSEGHRLRLFIDKISKKNVLHELFLKPLSKEITQRIVADTLSSSAEGAVALSELIFKKTEGNPFFIGELLNNLHREGYIHFSFEEGKWVWDMDKVQDAKISDNVVEFMVARLKKLSPETQETLQLASCIGNIFDITTLSIVSKQDTKETVSKLWESLEQGIIIPMSNEYSIIGSQGKEGSTDVDIQVRYKFQHDRIQQAAYELIELSQKKKLHLSIGKLLLGDKNLKEIDAEIIDIVNHFNNGRELITEEKDTLQLAEMNLIAGKRALFSAAYQPALQYFKVSKSLLTEEHWKKEYELSLAISKGFAESAYLSGEFEKAEEEIHIAVSKANTAIDKALIYQMQALQYSVIGKLEDAILMGVKGLSCLGVKVPPRPSQLSLLREIFLIRKNMKGRDIEVLIDLPELLDEEKALAMKLLNEVSAPAYVTGNENLLGLVVLKQVNISLCHGNSYESAFAYVVYGMILSSAFGKLEQGCKFGKLGISLNEKTGDLSLRCRINLTYAISIHAWNYKWTTLKEYFDKAIESGYDSGDLFYLAYSCLHVTLWNPTLTLGDSIEEGKKYMHLIEETRYLDAISGAQVSQQTRLNLFGATKDRTTLSDLNFSEEQYFQTITEAQNLTGVALYYFNKLKLHVFYEDYERALTVFYDLEKVSKGLDGIPWIMEFYFFSFLLFSSYIEELPYQQRLKAKLWMRKAYKKIKKWAEHCPENFEKNRLLMEAEMARLSRSNKKAEKLYDEAIQNAQKSGHVPTLALANEYASRFYRLRDDEHKASFYLKKAESCYRSWGAKAKLDHLSENYTELLRENRSTHRRESDRQLAQEAEVYRDSNLDLEAILKVSRAISEEVVFAKLIRTLMTVVLKFSGAKRGFLILKGEEEKWFIHALADEDKVTILGPDGSLKDDSEEFSVGILLSENTKLIPMKVIDYVRNAQEYLVLDNASQNEIYGTDSYFQKNEVRSVLCNPIMKQGEVIGFLYLENNLSIGAFTERHIAISNQISSQAAISIENAKLYEEQRNVNVVLEQKVEERTHELKETLDTLKNTQEQLVQAEKMKGLNTVVAGIAHDINTPMGIIHSSSDQIESEASNLKKLYGEEELTEERLEKGFHLMQDLAKLLVAESSLVTDIVKKLKTVSADLASEQRKLFRVKEYLEDIFKTLIPEIKTYDLDINLEINGDESIEVNHYPGLWYRVLMNLFINSLQHGYNAGDAGSIRLNFTMEDGTLQMIYADDGKGISEDNIKKVFEPFFTTKGGAGANGLGMANVFSIINDFGGSIDCQSEVGSGTTFTITIENIMDDPATTVAEEEAPA